MTNKQLLRENLAAARLKAGNWLSDTNDTFNKAMLGQALEVAQKALEPGTTEAHLILAERFCTSAIEASTAWVVYQRYQSQQGR